jgi:hypothetical protein
MRTMSRLLVAVALVATALPLTAQTPAPAAPAALRPAADQWRGMHWRNIGPEGNRFAAAAGVVGDPLTYFVGSASGGVWKTTDGGVNWRPTFDAHPVQSIGSLAVARSDRNVVWAGTGEAHIRSHISVGQGIYKSTDGGEHVDPDGTRADGAHRSHRDPSDEPRHRPGLRAGPRVRTAAGAWRLPHDRWRRHLDEGAVRRREHRLLGPRDGCRESARALRRHVADRDPHLGAHQRRARERPLQVDRRRRHLGAAARQRAPDEAARQGRAGTLGLEPESGVRDDRDG